MELTATVFAKRCWRDRVEAANYLFPAHTLQIDCFFGTD